MEQTKSTKKSSDMSAIRVNKKLFMERALLYSTAFN